MTDWTEVSGGPTTYEPAPEKPGTTWDGGDTTWDGGRTVWDAGTIWTEADPAVTDWTEAP